MKAIITPIRDKMTVVQTLYPARLSLLIALVITSIFCTILATATPGGQAFFATTQGKAVAIVWAGLSFIAIVGILKPLCTPPRSHLKESYTRRMIKTHSFAKVGFIAIPKQNTRMMGEFWLPSRRSKQIMFIAYTQKNIHRGFSF